MRPVRSSTSTQPSRAAASPRPRPKQAATSRFSKTVSFSNGCGTWWERQIPARHRAPAGMRVMSRPSSRIVPRSAATAPVMSAKSVVLPAPFGPSTPSTSPAATSSDTSEVTVSEP